MVKFTILTAAVMLVFITPVYAETTFEINVGSWEINTTVEMPGMPVAIPPTKHTQCITKEELIPQASAEKQDCTMIDQKISRIPYHGPCNATVLPAHPVHQAK